MNCCPNFDVCDCDCHRLPSGMMQHCMPCCNTCPYCGKNIKWFRFDDHTKKCSQRREICDCLCHESFEFLHKKACCSPCPICNQNIRMEYYDQHIEGCHKA